LSAANLEVLRELKTYGKRTILVINQMDVLDEADRATVKDFVSEQSRLHMGVEPVIWTISAKQALEAQQESPRDEILYDASGFAEMEEYLTEALADETRIRQNRETGLQIAHSVRENTVSPAQANHATLAGHRKTLT